MTSFQSAHVHFFWATGGVYQEVIYDNMRVAVRKFVGPHEREPTEGLLELRAHYHFEFRFCNIGKGKEKGHVERAVEFIRRKAFCQDQRFESLSSAQAHLDEVCMGLNARQLKERKASPGELMEHEQKRLYPVSSDFSAGEWLSLRVDKYSCFCCGQNHYSVPDHLVGKKAQYHPFFLFGVVHFSIEIVVLFWINRNTRGRKPPVPASDCSC